MPLPSALALGAIPLTPSELRWELAGVAIGFILLSIGVAALALFLFRRRTSDFTLVYFSSFSILYAIRLLSRERLIRWLFPVRAVTSDARRITTSLFSYSKFSELTRAKA
jgi:hypothetical protein